MTRRVCTVNDWVHPSHLREQAVARLHRSAGGRAWRVGEPDGRVAHIWQSASRAIDEQGPVIDSDVREHRAAPDAAACGRRSRASTGGCWVWVTTDTAAGSPPAVAAVVPGADSWWGRSPRTTQRTPLVRTQHRDEARTPRTRPGSDHDR